MKITGPARTASEVFVSGGAASAEDLKRVTVKGAQSRTRASFWPQKGYEAQMKSFLTRLQSGSPLEVTVRDGARATLEALRMLESARTQTPCAIDLETILG